MDDNTRTKVLGGALACILGFMFLKPALLKPIEKADADLDSAERALEKAETRDFELLSAQERISRGRDTSLPPQTADAQRVYQRWLNNLAEQCKFTASTLKVTPGTTDFKRGRFLTVDVIVEGETKLEGLSKFLFLFEQADLKHRITSLDIETTGYTKDAFMEVTLTAQGMSVVGTPEHDDVFPLTRLPESVAADATELTVADAKGFPKKTPFMAQLGREMVTVTATEGNKLTIERSQLGTSAADHPEDTYIQLFPVAFGRKDVGLSDYASLIDSSPFTKPVQPKSPNPRLASLDDKTIAPGEAVEMTAKTEDIDEDVGEVKFVLEDAAEGMAIDPDSGKFTWTPAEELEATAYSATVVATQKNNPDLKLEKKVTITIKLPNESPEISVPENAVVVLGREFSVDVSATDDGPEDSLTFSLDGEIPDGLTIDGKSLKWSPPKTFTPGEYKVSVKVADGGDPAKSDSGEISLSVRDDTALMTRFTGSVTLDGQPIAFFRDMAANKKPQLKVGDHIEAAEIDAEVTEVSRRHILLADAEGVWRLNLGQNLRERELIEPAEKPEKKPEAEEGAKETSGDKPQAESTDKEEPVAADAEKDETAAPAAEKEADEEASVEPKGSTETDEVAEEAAEAESE